MIHKNTKLIVILGPTASGKTALALDIASKVDGEIICADSRTIYRHLDIGTAKPTPAEQATVPHHLLDICEPGERLNAAEFKRRAEYTIDDIWRRGRVPLLVGGSGLYIDSILYDYQFPPEADPQVRASLDALSNDDLLARLDALDSIQAAEIDRSNRRRVVRAIETAGVGKTKRETVIEQALVLGLSMNKEIAQQRITLRTQKMLEEGFIDEVRMLANNYGWDNDAFNIIGYRAFKPVLQQGLPLDVGKEAFIAGDMALYKKQLTWFKRNQEIKWLDKPDDALPLVRAFLGI